MVKRIVQRFRPNLNFAGTIQTTPLLMAVKQSQRDMAQYLVHHGADVALAVDEFNTALHYACCHVRGSMEMLQILLQPQSGGTGIVNVTNCNGYTALHMACMENKLDMVDCLLRAGAAVNLESDRGQSALTIACHARNTALCERLLQAGANPWLSTRFGCPVAVTIRTGDFAMFQMLVHHRYQDKDDTRSFHIDQRMEQGRTIAHVSASHGRLEFLQWTINQKCNVNARDDHGMTPLHVLCNASSGLALLKQDRKDDECIRLLVSNGSNMDARDNLGNAAIHYAIAQKSSILETLLQLGVSPNTVNAKGRTPLHLFCESITTKLYPTEHIDILVNAGANLNQVDSDGNAPIHYAVKNNAVVLERLLQVGANPNTRNQDGQTVLHIYCADPSALSLLSSTKSKPKRKSTNNAETQNDIDKVQSEIATMLYSKGSDGFCRDKQGNLPMFLAAEQGVLPTTVFEMVRQSAWRGFFEKNDQRSTQNNNKKQSRMNSPEERHKRRRTT